MGRAAHGKSSVRRRSNETQGSVGSFYLCSCLRACSMVSATWEGPGEPPPEPPWQPPAELEVRAWCRSTLKAIAFVMSCYVMDHDGAFPPRISSVREAGGYPPILMFLKHGTEDRPPPGTSVEDWMDYFYVYWPEGVKTPGDYSIL